MAKVTLTIESTTQDIAREIKRTIDSAKQDRAMLEPIVMLLSKAAGFQIYRREDFVDKDDNNAEDPRADASSSA